MSEPSFILDDEQTPIPETESQAANDDPAERELFYQNPEEWVNDWLLPHFRRNPRTFKWDPQWWQYEEVGTVLEALWESWEEMRWEEATKKVAWWRDYLWPVMDRLTAEDGPFWAYDPPQKVHAPEVWPTTPTPAHWW